MKIKVFFQKALPRLCGAFVLLTCSACEPSLPTPPVSQVLGLGTGGESVEFDFQVKEFHGYVVNLDIYFHNPQNLDERRQLIYRLGERVNSDGSVDEVRIPITLRVRVKSLQVKGPAADFDQTADKIGFVDASEKYATKRVLVINNHLSPIERRLQPGRYRIRVDNLHPVPELADYVVKLTLSYANEGK